MSSLIVEVSEVKDVSPLPNADKLEAIKIKGWDVVVQKNTFKPGQKCVYFPPDSVLTEAFADKLGIKKYLSKCRKADGADGYRVRVANLRSFKSYGTVMPCENPDWELGKDMAEHYGVTKWEPPLRCEDGDAERAHPAFHHYYDMENIKNFPDVFQPGEPVVITEKLHGMNCRLGLVRDVNDKGEAVWKWMAGSNNVRRKRFNKNGEESVFWKCFTPEIRALLAHSTGMYSPEDIDREPPVVGDSCKDIVMFLERFGANVQDMWYGMVNGNFTVRAFDMTVNGRYMDTHTKYLAFTEFDVSHVPILYRGPFSMELVQELTEGPTTICKPEEAGPFKGREGIVITSEKEREVVTEKKVMGRAQLKSISFAYEMRRNATEDH